ncbi:MAG: IPTL-CTERM sorting domain-containing protein, partial [Acidobacteriota bacterium]
PPQLSKGFAGSATTMPMGMVVADPANPFDSCGGTLTAVEGDGVITFADGTVAAGGVCQVSVDITITSPGDFMNVADDLTSNLGASAPGSAVAALAGGTLLDIPTMSTAGLVGLAGLLALLAVVTIRRRS